GAAERLMTDVEQIFWILVALYLFASAYWVRHGALVFVSAAGGRHRLRRAAVLQNDSGGLVFGNLLPCGTAVLGQAWPISLSPAGVGAAQTGVRPLAAGDFVAFENLKTVTAEGTAVRINDLPFLKLSTSNYASLTARLIRKLADLPSDQRG